MQLFFTHKTINAKPLGALDIESINRFSPKQVISAKGETVVVIRDNKGNYSYVSGSIDDFENLYEKEFKKYLILHLNERLTLISNHIKVSSINTSEEGKCLVIHTYCGKRNSIYLKKSYTRYIMEDILNDILEIYDI